jgi:hypothetical protein
VEFLFKYFHLICHLILNKINCITLKIRSKAVFKSKSQNIWQQIILLHTFLTKIIVESVCFISCEPFFWCNYSYVVHTEYIFTCLQQTCTRICRFLIFGNIFRLETCMNSLVKRYCRIPNWIFRGKISSPKTGVILL